MATSRQSAKNRVLAVITAVLVAIALMVLLFTAAPQGSRNSPPLPARQDEMPPAEGELGRQRGDAPPAETHGEVDPVTPKGTGPAPQGRRRGSPYESPRVALAYPHGGTDAPQDRQSGERTCSLSGRVQVSGVADARVSLHLRREENWEALESWQTTARGAGYFAFEGLRPGWYALTAIADGAMPMTAKPWQCLGRGAAASVDLELQPGQHVITGQVMDSAGEAVPEANVTVVQIESTAKFLAGAAWIPTAENGRFRLSVKNGHDYIIYASAFGYQFADVSVRAAGTVQPGKEHEVTVVLHRDERPIVRGTVLLPSGEPAAGAMVYRGPSGATSGIGKVQADARGQFSIQVATDVKFVIGAILGGTVGWDRFDGLAANEEHVGVHITLAPGRTVEGNVVDDVGNPVPYARLLWRNRRLGLYRGTTADHAGSFFLSGIPADRAIDIIGPGGVVHEVGTEQAEVEVIAKERPSRPETLPTPAPPARS